MARTSSMRGGRQRQLKSDINVVPYIDVMLVLLIIFMVAAPMTNPGVINLPRAEKTALPPSEFVEITLRADGSTRIGLKGPSHGTNETESVASRAELMSRLRDLHARNNDMPVMIAADKDVKYDDVVQVYSETKKIGVGRVGLVTKQ